MRGLTRQRPRRSRWTRLRGRAGERGGIAVATALLMPIFLGLGALAVDTAGVWAARQQVVNGADAAALAVATDCAAGNCGDIKPTAESYFFANNEAAKLADLKAGSGWIYVNGRQTRATGTWLVRHFFAGALGFPTGSLTVESTAAWAPVASSTSGVALAVSWCTFQSAGPVNGGSTVRIDPTGGPSGSCGGPTGGSTTAGSMWTTTSSGSVCGTTAAVQTAVTRYQPTASRPAGCTSAYLAGLVGRTIDLPVWSSVSGGSAQVYGWASLRVTAADATSISGRFVNQPRQVGDATPPPTTAPDLGARAVFLTDPSTWTGARCQDGATTC